MITMSSKNFHQRQFITTPPISVITTGASSTTSSHNSNRRDKNIVTPTILLKPSSSSQQLQQQQQQQPMQQPMQQLQHIYTEKDDKDIDSALLSALRDPKERLPLLRLEGKIIEFMNDTHSQYMDVGGSFNNILIKGPNENTYTNPTNSSGISGAGTGTGGQQHKQATAFHKLCLHRLADRFNIVRQQHNNIVNNNNKIMYSHNMNNYHYPGGTTGFGIGVNGNGNGSGGLHLIRLVKIKESRIPTIKLIDIDVDNYETNHNQSTSIPQDRGLDSAEACGGSSGRVSDANLKGISDKISGMHLDNHNNSNHTSSTTGKKSKKKDKVKIMKRSPNESGHKTTNKGNDKEKNKRRGKKNLSEKEKAYAEARARIFNTQEASSSSISNSNHNNNNLDESDHVNSTNHSANISLNNSHNNIDEDSLALVSDSKVSATDDGGGSSLDRLSPVSQQQQQINTSSENCDENEDNANVPAAAKGGAESKVLWRNRQQEATDPDFRRAHHPIMVQQPVYYQHHPAMVSGQVAYNPGVYQYQGSMDPMGYSNHHSQHAYYHQIDASWQIQNAYTRHPSEGSTSNLDEGRNNQQQHQNRQQQAPAYTEEEFPALG